MKRIDTDAILEWQHLLSDNSDPENTERGIVLFGKKMFPQSIDSRYGTPEIHIDMYRQLLDLFNPAYRFPTERQLQLIVFRGASKSTISNLVFVSYILCFNGKHIILPDGHKVAIEEDLIVIGSETNAFAVNWVSRVRTELSLNKDIKLIFGRMKPASIRDDEGRWRLNAFTAVKNGTGIDSEVYDEYMGRNATVVGLGVGQQTRGMNISGRPSLILADDLYSAKGLVTDEARAKTRYWFENELVNTLDPVKGKIVSIGTVVHEDTIVVDNKNSRFWRTVEYPLMEVDKFNEVLNKYCQINRDLRRCIIPSTEECEKLEHQGYVTNWNSRFRLEGVLMKLSERIEKPSDASESGFWQEYFHLIISERDKAIRADQIVTIDFSIKCKNRITYVGIIKNEEIEWRNLNTILVVDSATSDSLGAAKTAIVWVGMDYLSNIYILHSSSGNYGVYDTKDEETGETKVGTINQIIRIIQDHTPKVGIEVYNVGAEILRQLKYYTKTIGKRLTLFPIVQTENKLERIVQTLSPYYQSKSVIHKPGQDNLVHQLQYLGKTKFRDEADALESAVRNLNKPAINTPLKEKDKKPVINQMERILLKNTKFIKNEEWITI